MATDRYMYTWKSFEVPSRFLRGPSRSFEVLRAQLATQSCETPSHSINFMKKHKNIKNIQKRIKLLRKHKIHKKHRKVTKNTKFIKNLKKTQKSQKKLKIIKKPQISQNTANYPKEPRRNLEVPRSTSKYLEVTSK